MEKCENCVFFKKVRDLSNVASTMGACRRYPPKPFILPSQGQIATISAAPQVDEKDFCGEYRAKIAVKS